MAAGAGGNSPSVVTWWVPPVMSPLLPRSAHWPCWRRHCPFDLHITGGCSGAAGRRRRMGRRLVKLSAQPSPPPPSPLHWDSGDWVHGGRPAQAMKRLGLPRNIPNDGRRLVELLCRLLVLLTIIPCSVSICPPSLPPGRASSPLYVLYSLYPVRLDRRRNRIPSTARPRPRPRARVHLLGHRRRGRQLMQTKVSDADETGTQTDRPRERGRERRQRDGNYWRRPAWPLNGTTIR